MQLNDVVLSYKEEMVSQLCKLISMPSLEAPPLPGQPFGRAMHDCLLYTLDLAKSLGFARMRDVDGYAGYIEMGQGEEEIGILVHLDVVPPGDGWTLPPFEGTVQNGRVYGRGSQDNKGGVIAALYAMRALLSEENTFHKRVRLILGCSEETGMTCIDHYLEAEHMPDYGFSPDANYPLINLEKGLLNVVGHCAAPVSAEGLRVVSMSAGQRPNVIPGRAEAVFFAPDTDALSKALSSAALCDEDRARVHLSLDGHTATLICDGIVGHASTPEKGRNAASLLLRVLSALPLADAPRENAVKALSRLICDESDGTSLGVACQDELSGALTCNLGLLGADEAGVNFTLDFRYPLCTSQDAIMAQLASAFADSGFALKAEHGQAPHHVPEDSPLVQKLLRVYAEQTGQPSYCMAIGGGTYARKLPGRAVAFGMEFPGTPATAHMADEYIIIDELVQNAQIIAHAIRALAIEPW
mgnify:FL=1